MPFTTPMGSASPSPSTGSFPTVMTAHPGMRRSATVPTQLLGQSTSSSTNFTSEPIEVLYEHPNVKIVSFTVTISRPASRSGKQQQSSEPPSPAPQSIPWHAPSERTLANGTFRIYRVPSSGVSFLNSGSFLRHVLPRTQCWCVDQSSKFVFRVNMQGSFYRIELPSVTSEDKARLDDFRAVLNQILLFERTPSPFVTGVLTHEDDAPPTPIRRESRRPPERAKKWVMNKMWEPEDSEQREHYRRTSVDMGASKVKQMVAAREGRSISAASVLQHVKTSDYASSESGSEADTGSIDNQSVDFDTTRTDTIEEAPENIDEIAPMETAQETLLHRPTMPSDFRSITAPLSTIQRPLTPPEAIKPQEDGRFDSPLQDQDSSGINSNRTSFYSCDSASEEELAETGADGSFSMNNVNSVLDSPEFIIPGRSKGHKRDVSDITIRAAGNSQATTPLRATFMVDSIEEQIADAVRDVFEDQQEFAPVSEGSAQQTTLVHESSIQTTQLTALLPPLSRTTSASSTTPLPDTLRLRRLTQRLSDANAYKTNTNRFSIESSTTTTSTTSAGATVYYTPPGSPRAQKLLSIILQKAYRLILGPPAELVALMLRIAARVCLGLPIFYDSEEFDDRTPKSRASSDSGTPGKGMPGYWETSSASSVAATDDGHDDEDNEDDFGVCLKNLPGGSTPPSRDPLSVFRRGSSRQPSFTRQSSFTGSAYADSVDHDGERKENADVGVD